MDQDIGLCGPPQHSAGIRRAGPTSGVSARTPVVRRWEGCLLGPNIVDSARTGPSPLTQSDMRTSASRNADRRAAEAHPWSRSDGPIGALTPLRCWPRRDARRLRESC